MTSSSTHDVPTNITFAPLNEGAPHKPGRQKSIEFGISSDQQYRSSINLLPSSPQLSSPRTFNRRMSNDSAITCSVGDFDRTYSVLSLEDISTELRPPLPMETDARHSSFATENEFFHLRVSEDSSSSFAPPFYAIVKTESKRDNQNLHHDRKGLSAYRSELPLNEEANGSVSTFCPDYSTSDLMFASQGHPGVRTAVAANSGRKFSRDEQSFWE
jgi:hypothetical protein